VEGLEARNLLTTFTPNQIRHGYGFDRVMFEDATHSVVAGNGQGMTIGIIDPYDDPNIAGDLAHFDSVYAIAAPPSFSKVNQTGGTTYPAASRSWAREIALDVEYAHAMAPGANILLVEANSNSSTDLDTAVRYAANHGAAAVSMSYGGPEYSGELAEDSVFFHTGVTYLSATGDNGAPGNYQAFSPYVVAVGGTSLFLDSQSGYVSESGWSGSGGGISRFENQPAYQSGIVTQSSTRRTTPDVSFVADPNTGVLVYDTYGGSGLYGTGGTSAATPIMAGVVAIIDQGRSYLFGRSSYNGTDFLNALYHLPQSDINDITTGGSTGSPHYSAGPGYDLVTGRGTPIVDRFVSGMIGAPVYNPLTGGLLVTGGGRGSTDTITLRQSGSQLVVQVSTDNPVAGSSIPASQTFTFNRSQYSLVTIAAGDGTTTLNVDASADAADLGNVVLSGSSLAGLSLGTINFGAGGINSLNITGGDGNNVYTIAGTPANQGTTLNTGGGADTVNVQATTFALTVNSASGSGADVITLGNVGNQLSDIMAGVNLNASGTDALVLNDQGFTSGRAFTVADTMIGWDVVTVAYSGLGSVKINGGTGGNTFEILTMSLTAAVNIVGGGSGNTFAFADGASLNGNIVGSGADTLNYTAYSTSVVVDLQTGLATGIGGSVSGIATIYGGSAGPVGSGVFNLLIGSGGNTLVGGTGRPNIVVAGSGPGTLNGGDGQDLLIAGYTAYDTDPALTNWLQIAAYWAGTDDYGTRIANLASGTGVPLLDGTVASGNGGGNILVGAGGLAFIYSDGLDSVSGFDPGFQIFPTSP
jgi:hypothetical protein